MITSGSLGPLIREGTMLGAKKQKVQKPRVQRSAPPKKSMAAKAMSNNMKRIKKK